MKPENVLICLSDEEVNQIARENRLKQGKNNQSHLKKDRNIAELALGKAFKNMSAGENPAQQPLLPDVPTELKPIDSLKPLKYDNCEGFVVTTYAEIIPGYSGFNKNKKKKLRSKHQAELLEINNKRFDEFVAASKQNAQIAQENELVKEAEAKEIDAPAKPKEDKKEEELSNKK